MTSPESVAARRAVELRRLFPDGLPPLWCPALTHYSPDGAGDAGRMAAHLAHLAPFVGGFLIPGSTGDAWELTPAERDELRELALVQAARLRRYVLVGVLHATDAAMVADLQAFMAGLRRRAGAGAGDAATALAAARVAAFTVCPPTGAQLTQVEIRAALSRVLALGLPTAIYQLPQVTGNELAPEVAAELAAAYDNFLFFKDTSGADRVVLARPGLSGVFTLRGAEGDYARWFAAAGGPYQGFLLSAANCFARELADVFAWLQAGRPGPAAALSTRVAAVVADVFALVRPLPWGNAFANANKAMDHFFAHGARAARTAPPPRLHAGPSLPREVIAETGRLLEQHGFLPASGYLGA